MSNQSLSPGADGGRISLNDAPGADLSFDDLFPPEGSVPAQPQAVAQGTQPPQPPQAPVDRQPFLKAGESIYNTAEDAVNGIAHKDALVSRYRAFLNENGFDPNTLQKKPQAESEPRNDNHFQYFGNPGVFDELANAVKSGDKRRYEQVMAMYNAESIQANLAPYAPLLAEVSRSRAVRQVAQEIPEFEQFYSGQDFRQVQEKLPMLKEAIQATENNPAAAERLRELYQISYLINQGLKSTSQPVQAQPVQTAPPARPTTAPSNLTPPPPGMPTTNWATNRDARKQLIQDVQNRGGDNADWTKIGL